MITKDKFREMLLNKATGAIYDPKTDTIFHNNVTMSMDELYQSFLKKNGMSFDCIYDVHWECMSILRCNKCGTIVKYYYDENYEPDFRCPICTNYETSYKYYTKEEIESNEELQAIIKMYEELREIDKKREERKEKRNGLNDWQLCETKYIKFGDNIYRLNLLIDSIENKNKLKGLRLEISKLKRDEECRSILWTKTIPLSISAYNELKYVFSKENNINPLNGKSLIQILEESAVKKLKKY